MADDTHDHAGHDHAGGEYYFEQLLTIGVSGSFAVVAVMMYRGGTLNYILAPELRPWVFYGGIALFVLTMVRVVALWRATAPAHVHGVDCDHAHHAPGHVHGPDCDHDHAEEPAPATADHDHADHDHGNIFWRVVVLMFPIALFVTGLPNSGFSQDRIDKMLGKDAEVNVNDVAATGGNVFGMSFADLAAAASDPDARANYAGQSASIVGQMKKKNDKEFTLYFMKVNCCAADMIPLKARIFSDTSISQFDANGWVEVTGTLQFAQADGQFVPVVRTTGTNIKKTKPQQ